MENNDHKITANISRRDFVKASSLTAGGLLLGSLPVINSAYAAGNDTLKVALIGAGGRGTGAAFNFLNSGENIKIVAIADIFQDRLDTSYEQLNQHGDAADKVDVPPEHRFVGFDGYKKATELADIVILAAPPGMRPPHFKEAVNQGKHVFMEKPVAVDAPGVRSILDSGKIAKEKGLNVVVGLQRRYQFNYRELHRRVSNREIGDIISGQVYWNQGPLWLNEREPQHTELEYQMRNWYYFTWICGDHNLEQHIHQLDVANWFLGEYPESAQGMGGREVRTGKEYGQIFDHHYVEYTYPSGVVINSQSRQMPGCFNKVSETLHGTRGIINLDGSHTGIIRDWNKQTRFEYDSEGDPDPYQNEINELLRSIRQGNIIDDTEFGAKATLTGVIGRMATYSGNLITWEDAMQSEKSLAHEITSWDTRPPVTPDEDGFYPVPVPGETEVL